MSEASIERTEHGQRAVSDGWYVLNAREAQWRESDAFGRWCVFEGDAPWPQVAINLHLLEPGKPACMYHGEDIQENFLVLSGECFLIVDGEQRRLRQWDFVHCPPWVEHVFVGAEGPSAVLMIGARPDLEVRYRPDPAAARHGACVTTETPSADEAYAPFGDARPVAYRDGDLH